MDLTCDERQSDSAYIDTIWRSESEHAGSFISMAETHYGLVVTKYGGKTTVTVRGPETRATLAYSHADAEFLGIRFKAGVYMPELPPLTIMDRRDQILPEASSRSFWLNGSVWQYPNYENVDTFVDRLARAGWLVRDPLVSDALARRPPEASERTVQRRFLRTTGLTRGALDQIQRARYATTLLKQGLPILDAVVQAGYFDQPHLTRSLKRFIGLTPSQISDQGRPQRLSFLYKTTAFDPARVQVAEAEHESNSGFRIPDAGRDHARPGRV